ncbi:MAG TPA: S8 family serine peptidase [Syntrophobacteraceae bacterium]|nr:S8 family serine peptidase [Syntrophobacteraceae bacterium]
MSRWGFLLALITLGLLFASDSGAYPAGIHPDLESILAGKGDRDELSVIVTLAQTVDLDPSGAVPRKALRGAMIRALKRFAASSQAPLKAFLSREGVVAVESLWLINGLAVKARPDVIRKLAQLPGVSQVLPDRIIPLFDTSPVIGPMAQEWNLSAVEAPRVWRLGFRGQGVVVANMDTGADGNHPDLKSRWRGGANSWWDPFRKTSAPYDVQGHGTQTMGILVGGKAGGTAIGVAPKARWIAAKIFNDSGSSTSSVIHQAFQWLLDPDGDPDTDDAPDVVNCSWGVVNSPGRCIEDFHRDIRVLKRAGIAVVFSAGNSGEVGPDSSISPANNPGVFSVGAVDSGNNVAYFSSLGPSACTGKFFPTVVAPGTGIKSADPVSAGVQGSYAAVDGTSFSAPHVAGTMALLLSAFPGLSVPTLETALKASALDLGNAGADNLYGRGLINAFEALRYLQSRVTQVTLNSVNAQDGWIRESSKVPGTGAAARSAGNVLVGDDAGNRQLVGFLSFDTSILPADAVITSAKIFLTRKAVRGTNPFALLKKCFVDLADGTFNTAALEIQDFQAATPFPQVARMSNPAQNGDVSVGELGETALRAIPKGSVAQVRVRFAKTTNGNSVADQVVFWGDDGVGSQRPRLEITYMLP